MGGWAGGDANVHWHWRNHQNKEFCRLLTDINSTKLSKIAGTQQIDRQWLSLKKFVFSNLHRKVKTLVGSEVNPSLRRRCFQYVWRCNLQTCTPLVMLKELAKLVKNKVTPPVKTRAVLHSGISDVLQDMWHSCPKVFAIVVSVLPAVGPLPKALIDMACL